MVKHSQINDDFRGHRFVFFVKENFRDDFGPELVEVPVKPGINKELLFRLAVEVFHEIFVFFEKNFTLLSEPEQKVLDKCTHELQFLHDERRLVDVV